VSDVRQDPSWTGTEIAIVGAAGRFPGARSLAEYWTNLRSGTESIRRLTREELLAEGVPASLVDQSNYVPAAAVLDDMEWWDAKFWGFSPRDAAIMDPQHRLFLECAYEALEHAGHAPDVFAGPIGVYAGVGMGAYFQNNLLNNRRLMEDVGLFLVRHTGNDKDFLATRVSYALNLRGPSVNVQTACSTSLVAIHLAVQSLLNGEVDMALAGGVTIELPHRVGYLVRENEILSPDGHCRPFDAESRGTVFGSGAGVVVLRRLQDALDDGDHILAVIRGSAINNDGAGKVGYLAPSVDGQAAAIAEAIAMSGLTADSIQYVEAHGTGTAVGDPIEVSALTTAFRRTTAERAYCALGSVKSNIGHLDTAAGVAGLMKVMLAFEHGELPPTLHYRAPNPLIDFASTPFFVNADVRAWPRTGTPRRAGISSLGVGGTNAHVVVEEAPARPSSPPSTRRWQVLPISAKTDTALATAAANIADWLRDQPQVPLADVAWTLQRGRLAHAARRCIVAQQHDDAAARLDGVDTTLQVSATAASNGRSMVWMFAGGGAQYPAMAAQVYAHEPVFRAIMDEGLMALEPAHRDALRRALYPEAGREAEAATILERPSMSLPALFLTQVGIARQLMHWGLMPGAMIGHSMGEYSAAHLAGVFSLQDGVRLVSARGHLFETLPPGAMLSVPLAVDALRPFMTPELSIAAINAPELCVASGPVEAIAALEARLSAAGIDGRRVRINVAAHSSMLEGILERFASVVRTFALSAPTLPFVSNLSGTWITPAEAVDPAYWVRHLRETVRFADGLSVLLDDPDRLLMEIGPGRTLASLAALHPQRTSAQPIVTTLPHADDDTDDQGFLLGAVAALWTHGVPVDWKAMHEGEPRQRVPLPTYPWERQRYWIDADRPALAASSTVPGAAEPTASLTRREQVDDWMYAPVWHRAITPAPGALGEVWLLAEDGAATTALDAALRARGARICRVQAGDGFVESSPDRVSVRRDATDDWVSLWQRAGRQGRVPSHIVHTWAADATVDEVAAFHSIAALGQALIQEDVTVPLTMTVLTAAAHDVIGDDVRHPMGALAMGPVNGFAAELPAVSARVVDLDRAMDVAPDEKVVQAVVDEIAALPTDTLIAHRNGRRWVRRFEPAAMRPTRTEPVAPPVRPQVRQNGVYLITGGLGGIGLSISEWLATVSQPTLLLTSRRPLPARAVWDAAGLSDGDRTRIEAIRRLEAAGATVQVVAADVTDIASMRRVVHDARAQFGAIHGVVHAAGILADGLLAMKTRAEMEAMLAPKVRGALVLDDVFGDSPLDFFVAFSSISAMAALPGQIDYAAANAFLDSWSAQRSARGTPTLSLAWSAWRDVGMVAMPSATDTPLTPSHPLLERVLRHGNDALFACELSTERHWVMAEHRLADGPSLVPGTGYLEIARAALAPWATQHARTLELRDVAFLSPLVLRDDLPREMRIAVRTGAERAEFAIVGATPPGEDGVPWEEHVMGSAALVASGAAGLDLAAIAARCSVRVRTPSVNEVDPNLAFGPRWKNVRRIAVGQGEALLDLALDPAFAADLAVYTLHPALMDMATAGAQELIPTFDAQRDFFVPLSYARISIHAPLPATIHSHIRLRPSSADEQDLAVFDVTITDGTGAVLVDIEEFIMTRVADRSQLVQRPGRNARRRSTLDLDRSESDVPAVAEPGWYADAIRPTEGVAAFSRALGAAGDYAHLLVSPFPLPALLARLRDVAPPVPAAPPAPVVPRVPVADIEATLKTQEAVADALVMQRADRTGSVRLVAYVQLRDQARATVSELRRFLKKQLAAHLVPSTYVLVDQWPRTAGGDIDQAQLSDPFGAVDDFVAPRTPTEQAVAAVWSDVLGIARISVRDNFFDIGGHSLLSVRVITKLDKALGVRLNQAIMVLQTLEQIAAECDKRLAEQSAQTSARIA
jgi:acyl transferase domain-containing protein